MAILRHTETRSNLYYEPKSDGAENLRFMGIIDRQFLETPWYGSRQMARYMKRNDHQCGRRLMRPMCFVPIHCLAGYRAAMHDKRSGTEYQQQASTT